MVNRNHRDDGSNRERSRLNTTRRLLIASIASAFAFVAIGVGSAQAMPFFTGDQTSVLVTSFFTLTDGAGLTLAPLGSAIVGDDVVDVAAGPYAGEPRKIAVFPITGGGVNTLTGDILIEHGGSGLGLSSASRSVDLENFDILLAGNPADEFIGELFGQVTVDGGQPLQGVPLFKLSQCGALDGPLACIDTDLSSILSGVRLGLTSVAAGLLNDVFFGGDAVLSEDFQIGVARVDVRVVPEPGTLVLMGLGLVGLAHSGRNRPRRAA